MNGNLIIHYVEWLSSEQFKWDTFLHLTMAKRTTLKRFKKAVKNLLTYMGGWGVFGFEYGIAGGCLHCHGIVEGRKKSTYDAWKWWFSRYGRNLIQDVKKDIKKRGIFYICKYAIKEGNFEIIGERRRDDKNLNLW